MGLELIKFGGGVFDFLIFMTGQEQLFIGKSAKRRSQLAPAEMNGMG